MADESAMRQRYGALGDFSDLVDLAERQGWFGWARGKVAPLSEADARAAAHRALGPRPGDDETPRRVRVERRFTNGDLEGEVVSWECGFGPRSEAYVLRPAGATGPLPGVVALHCHGGFKYYGKEKIADGPDGPPPEVAAVRSQLYGGIAYADALARRGFVVLVPDAFIFGSRRFALGVDDDVAAYNAAATVHEHVVEKHCRVLGTSLAALVAREDRIACAYLRSRPDVAPGGLGTIGLSGGGWRSGALHGTCPDVAASVVVAMMSTYGGELDAHIADHTWMLYPAGLPAEADWPDVVAARTEAPLFVLYGERDELFSIEGMSEADRHLAMAYANAGRQGGYLGRFYDVPHCFEQAMQQDAFAWLEAALGARH